MAIIHLVLTTAKCVSLAWTAAIICEYMHSASESEISTYTSSNRQLETYRVQNQLLVSELFHPVHPHLSSQ
jgi:hypothetical protein